MLRAALIWNWKSICKVANNSDDTA